VRSLKAEQRKELADAVDAVGLQSSQKWTKRIVAKIMAELIGTASPPTGEGS